jgi:hypothetical protein
MDQRLPVTVLSGFPGAGMDKVALRCRLDTWRVPREIGSMGSTTWPDLPDPFPVWKRAEN